MNGTNKEECLWNVKAGIYQNRVEKEKSLNLLADKFDISGIYDKFCTNFTAIFLNSEM